METHRRKRLEIVVEKGFLRHVTGLLRGRPEITGFTVLPCLGGLGHHGLREPDAITDVLDNVVLVAIMREEVARPLLDELMELLRDRVGIICLSDVEVMRAAHF